MFTVIIYLYYITHNIYHTICIYVMYVIKTYITCMYYIHIIKVENNVKEKKYKYQIYEYIN